MKTTAPLQTEVVYESIQQWATTLSERLVDIRFYDKQKMESVLAHYLTEALMDVLFKAVDEQTNKVQKAKTKLLNSINTKDYVQAIQNHEAAKQDFQRTLESRRTMEKVASLKRNDDKYLAMARFIVERLGVDALEEFKEDFRQKNPHPNHAKNPNLHK